MFKTFTLAACGLGEPFFQLCCMCVSFWFWQEIGFSLHTHVLRVQYSCGVVLVFWLRREIVIGVYFVLPPKQSGVLECMSVTISHILKNENYEICFLAGSLINQITTGKNYDRRKRYSHLADG